MDIVKTGELIASARKEKGFTQKELAAALHVSDKAVSNWERGLRFPDISLLESLSEQIGISVLEIVRGEKIAGEPLPQPVAVSMMRDMVDVHMSEMKRKSLKDIRIMAAFGLSLLLIVLCFVPFTSKVQRNLKGFLVYKADTGSHAECSVDIEGTYYDYLFREDHFDGYVKVNGTALGGGINRYTFGTTAALTSYCGFSDNPDRTQVLLFKGDVLINQTLSAVVASACYDDKTGSESGDEADRCLIIAPAYDDASAEDTLYSFVPAGLFPGFSTWDFDVLSWK